MGERVMKIKFYQKNVDWKNLFNNNIFFRYQK